MNQRFFRILLLTIALFLSACRISPPKIEEQLQGRLLVWHFFGDMETELFDDILDKYTQLHPKVKIVSEYVPAAQISEQFIQQAQSGLGPDLMISNSYDLPLLIEAGILQQLNDYNPDLSIYLPVAIEDISYQNKFYGLPFTLITQVLCYNTKKVTQPPTTLSGLMEEARAGRRVGLTSNFFATFWGVQIFGGKQFDAQGRMILDRGGFAEWLEWLKQAQNEPDLILSEDQSSLRKAFVEEKLAYYVCKSNEIDNLKAALGEGKLGVALLPGEADRPAGPILEGRALVFNRASSPAVMELALDLAQFLTNVEQQTRIVLETEAVISVNNQVRIDQRLSPITAVLLAQSKTSVADPLDYHFLAEKTYRKYGNLFYKRVLEGEMEASQAAAELTQKTNRALGWE